MTNKEDLEQQAIKVFNDPRKGLWGKTKMMAKYRKILNNMYALQRHRETNARMLRKHYRHETAKGRFHSVQVDLAFINTSDPIEGLMVVIDVYSRYMWVEPLKNRADLHIPLERVIKRMKTEFGHTPDNMTADNEFATTRLQALAAKYDFKWIFGDAGEKYRTGIVERSIRTLRNLIKRYRTQYDTSKYLDVLDSLIYNYNHTYHRTIRATPAEAMKTGKVNLNYKPKEIPELDKGQRVRIQEVRKKGFTKGDVPYYSKDVFKVIGRDLNRYILQDIKNRNRIHKRYGRHQLYKISDVPPIKAQKKDNSSGYDQGMKNIKKKKRNVNYLKRNNLNLNNIKDPVEREQIRQDLGLAPDEAPPPEIQRMDKIDNQIEKLRRQRGMRNKIRELQKKKDQLNPSVPLPPLNDEDDQKMEVISNARLNQERARRNIIPPLPGPVPKKVPPKAPVKPPQHPLNPPLRRSKRVSKPPQRYVPQDFRKPVRKRVVPRRHPKPPVKAPKRPVNAPLRRSSRVSKPPKRYVPIDFRRPKKKRYNKKILNHIKNKKNKKK